MRVVLVSLFTIPPLCVGKKTHKKLDALCLTLRLHYAPLTALYYTLCIFDSGLEQYYELKSDCYLLPVFAGAAVPGGERPRLYTSGSASRPGPSWWPVFSHSLRSG